MLSAHCAPKKASTTATGLSYLPPSLPLNHPSLSHTHTRTHMHTHLGTFTLSISMWQSAAAFEYCAWYAAFGKCEYELHKSSRGNGGSLCASCARPGQGRAGTAQASPGFTAFRLRTAESTKKEKTQSRSRRE